MTQHTTQTVLFPDLFHKPVVATFSQAQSSSDGGAILLKGADHQLSLTERLAQCIDDKRQDGKVDHTVLDLLRQRVYGIACGYADCNDSRALANDPVQKLLLDRDPIEGQSLGSQPTLSRFENAVSGRDLLRMAETLADIVVEHHQERLDGQVRRITIDLDPTDDPTHGAQQLTFFNGHYGSYCYLPMVGTLQFDNEPEKYLFTVVLRPGNAHSSRGVTAILMRLVPRLREAFPKARLRVRLDGGFATAEVLGFLDDLEQERVEYLVGIAGNSVLDRVVAPSMKRVRALSQASGKTETRFGETRYAAKTWPRRRRVIFKAEVVRLDGRLPRDNARFVVTNLTYKPERVYQIYRQRGDMENRIKELHHGLEIDRTSCTNFKANQLRVLMTAAAYVLMQLIRRQAIHTELASAQVTTLRERLFKLAVSVARSVRRIVLHLPQSYPWLHTWRTVARALGAV